MSTVSALVDIACAHYILSLPHHIVATSVECVAEAVPHYIMPSSDVVVVASRAAAKIILQAG